MKYPARAETHGFIIYYAIIMGLIMTLLAFIVSRVIDTNRSYLDSDNSAFDANNFARTRANIAFTTDINTNASGSTVDALSCSGWLITCKSGQAPLCNTTWTYGSDGISDACDNGNYQGWYYTGNVSNLLSPDSYLSDDDDLARRQISGLIATGVTDQVFAMNTPIKQAILLNTNNTGPAVMPDSVDSMVLNGTFSLTGGTVTIYQLDKNAFDTNKNVVVLSTFSGTILSNSGFLNDSNNFANTGNPFLLNTRLYDYVVFITNTTAIGVLSYNISASALGNPIYIIPLNDSVTPKTLLVPDYRWYNGEFIYRSQVVRE